jgi:LacI family transcriptional regulator
MSINLKQIAQQLDVSVSTVSRALAGKPGISATTRARVQDLANSLGYVPDLQASSLRTGKGHGLTIITGFNAAQITSMRNQALFSLGQQQFGQVRVQILNSGESLEQAVQQALQQNPNAIVSSSIGGELSARLQKTLCDKGIALTAMDARIPGCDSVPIIRTTGVYQATRLLLLSGCRHIVFYSAAGVSIAKPDERLKGIVQAYESLQRSPSEIHLVEVGKAHFKRGYEVTAELLKREPVDGLFCYSDETAVGALKALHEAGIRVPEEVKMVGFDNLDLAEYTQPSLTTVAQPVDDIAEAAIELCVRRLQSPKAPPQSRNFPTHLVVRASAPLASHAARKQVFELPVQV